MEERRAIPEAEALLEKLYTDWALTSFTRDLFTGQTTYASYVAVSASGKEVSLEVDLTRKEVLTRVTYWIDREDMETGFSYMSKVLATSSHSFKDFNSAQWTEVEAFLESYNR